MSVGEGKTRLGSREEAKSPVAWVACPSCLCLSGWMKKEGVARRERIRGKKGRKIKNVFEVEKKCKAQVT